MNKHRIFSFCTESFLMLIELNQEEHNHTNFVPYYYIT